MKSKTTPTKAAKKFKPDLKDAKPQVNPNHTLMVKRGMYGLGLFAGTDIPKGEFLIEYWGDNLTEDEANVRGGQYLFEVNKKKTIDGTTRKNTARYINHSCRPNCEVDIKKTRVLIETKKNIKAGEELCYDYGKDFWKEYIKPKGCRCPKCAEKALK